MTAKTEVCSFRLPPGTLQRLHRLAAPASLRTGRRVTASDLVRQSIAEHLLEPDPGPARGHEEGERR
jgi:hypothetical protein